MKQEKKNPVVSIESAYKVNFSVRDLFDVGAHLGHKVTHWNPNMSSYIHSKKNGMYIIDLNKTYGLLINALRVVFHAAKNKKKILFVGTRPETRDIVSEHSIQCKQFHVNFRWLGGTLTNWPVISLSMNRLNSLDRLMSMEDFNSTYTKKERLSFEKARDRLNMYFSGIVKMRRVPDLLVVLDSAKDRTAILEANKMKIPVISILDTNSDPKGITYPIPSNDDSEKCIKFYMDLFASTILSGSELAFNRENKDSSGKFSN